MKLEDIQHYNETELLRAVSLIGDEVQRRGKLLRFYVETMQARTSYCMWKCGFRLHAAEFTTAIGETPKAAILNAIVKFYEVEPLFREAVETVNLNEMEKAHD